MPIIKYDFFSFVGSVGLGGLFGFIFWVQKAGFSFNPLNSSD